MHTKEEWEQILKDDGYKSVRTCEDPAGAFYREHVHSYKTAHIVLKGSFSFTMRGKTREYHEGERVDVPAGRSHSGVMGPDGCTYLFGEA